MVEHRDDDEADPAGAGPGVQRECERPPHYPAELERVIRLADGTRVFVRPLVPDDGPALRRELAALDPESLYLRFFSPAPVLDKRQIRQLTQMDYRWRLALVGIEQEGRGVAVGRYDGTPETDSAEVSFLVRPDWRGRGLARRLLTLLEAAAMGRGIRRFRAYYLPENEHAAALFAHAGFAPPRIEGGVAEVRKALGAGRSTPV